MKVSLDQKTRSQAPIRNRSKAMDLKSDESTAPIPGPKMTFRFGRYDEYWRRRKENQCPSTSDIADKKSAP